MQSGADLGALKGAREMNIATGGYAPLGYRTEDGPKPNLGRLFGIAESVHSDYATRTRENIDMADVVIVAARHMDSPGTLLTLETARKLGKPLFEVVFPTHAYVENPHIVGDIRSWLNWHRPGILMFAGNRESVARGIEEWTQRLVIKIFS